MNIEMIKVDDTTAKVVVDGVHRATVRRLRRRGQRGSASWGIERATASPSERAWLHRVMMPPLMGSLEYVEAAVLRCLRTTGGE